MDHHHDAFEQEARAFGKRVALVLAARGQTPHQLAASLPGFNPASIYRILNARPPHNALLSTMVAIAEALDVPLHVLLGSDDASEGHSLVTEETLDLLGLLLALPPVWRRAVAAGVRSLVRDLKVGRADVEPDAGAGAPPA